MKPEDLEPLLLDRALGELSPPVAELLDAHLTRDPAAAQHAAAFAVTVQAARRAGTVAAGAPLRPLPLARFRQLERRRRWQSHLGQCVKLAACVLLGLGLSRFLWTETPRPDSAVVQAAPVTVAPADASGSQPGFWSMSGRLAAHRLQAARPERRERGYNLYWESPLKMPRLEEKP